MASPMALKLIMMAAMASAISAQQVGIQGGSRGVGGGQPVMSMANTYALQNSPIVSMSQAGEFRVPSMQERMGYMQNPQVIEDRKALMYPYLPEDLTEISSGKPIHDQPLQFRLPFFGFSYEYIWIQRDGYITFNKGMQTYRFPLKLPIQPSDTFVQEDPAMIAPFFAIQDITPDFPMSGVYFRIVNLADTKGYTNQFYEVLRDRIRWDFSEGMIGATDFAPKYAMIVTWCNMTVANRRGERDLKTNTYQAVIATDEIRTYAMFNYEQIEWVTHMDNYDGLKGAAAFVGFNAGNTTRTFEFRPYSQHQRVSMLPAGGFGNNLRGRYFFQIDEEVWPGACIDKKLDPNLRDRLPLTFFPRYGHMLGGTLVDVTGPCLDPSSIIFCRFDNFKAEAVFRGTNQATCISPPFMYHGYVDLTISVDERIEFVGRFYVQPPEVADEDVVVLDGKDREESPQELELKWRPQKLSWKNDSSVSISLWGYRETMNVYPQLTYITELTRVGRLGQAQLRIALDQFYNREDPEHRDMLFGFIGVNLTDPRVLDRRMRQSPMIWSRPMPLSWYFRPQWIRNIGYQYKDYFCRNWVDREATADRFAATVWRCPCTLQQVHIDRGRFSPDLQCNIIDRRCDTFHREALHCVNTGRPSIGGSGQTCCYDDQGELIQTADTIYGGRPSRAFIYGKHPFKIRMMIPSLSSWVHDVAPLFYCCLWQERKDNAESCQAYNQYRTSQDCSLYQPPVVGSVYGDPHMLTFNKNNYTFNGKGEYVLVHSDDPKVKFDVQARFEQVPRQFRSMQPIRATQLSAVAAQDNFSSIVEFRIRPMAARWRYHIYVLVDNEYVFWWDKSMQVQNFRGVTLYQPAGIQNMSHIIAMFDSGAGVEVQTIDGYMSAHVYLPADFQGITGGLLGNYSRPNQVFQSNDLVTPRGGRFSVRQSLSELHTFGQEWRLTEQERRGVGKTLFSHSAVRYAMFDDPNFAPTFSYNEPDLMFMDMQAQMTQQDLGNICSDSMSCIYDYMVSHGNRELALSTKKFEAIAFELANTAQVSVVRCPALPKPANGMKSENRYWPGKVVRFSCDVGFRLVGYEARYCREDGLWSWGEEAECISEWRYFFKMFGAIMGAFLPLAVTIAAGVFCIMYILGRGKSHYTGEAEMPLTAGAGSGSRGGGGSASGFGARGAGESEVDRLRRAAQLQQLREQERDDLDGNNMIEELDRDDQLADLQNLTTPTSGRNPYGADSRGAIREAPRATVEYIPTDDEEDENEDEYVQDNQNRQISSRNRNLNPNRSNQDDLISEDEDEDEADFRESGGRPDAFRSRSIFDRPSMSNPIYSPTTTTSRPMPLGGTSTAQRGASSSTGGFYGQPVRPKRPPRPDLDIGPVREARI